METIGVRIAKLRKEKGITQKTLADKIGVSDKAVSKWEQGGSPDIDLLPSIAKFFNVSIDYLVMGLQQKQSQSSRTEDDSLNLEEDATKRYKQTLSNVTKDGLICIDDLLKETNYLLIEKILTNNPIHYFELIEKYLQEENFRDLYYLAVERNWKEIINNISNQNYDILLNTAHTCLVYNATISENSKYFVTKTIGSDDIKKIKSEILLQIKTDLENKSILKTLTKEYFYSLLSIDDTDKLIIDLYRRFEAVLRGTFHYEGDFVEMLHKYCELECSSEIGELLNRYRRVRNGLVHSEKTPDSITKDELIKCIEHICAID